jgi:hypothetical protein
MSAARREAEVEYSRGSGASRAAGPPFLAIVFGLGTLGAAMLAVAEFTTLTQVKRAGHVISSVTCGSHHGYALLPIAAVALLLVFGGVMRGSRVSFTCVGVLAIGALAIALIGDLPDARKTGLDVQLHTLRAAPQAGFYLETLGGALLLIAAAGGLLLGPQPEELQGPRSG